MSDLPSPDKGLQVERTSLAFTRTALSILGVVAASLRWLPPIGSATVVGPVIAGLLVVGVTTVEWRHRPARLSLFATERARPMTGTGALLGLSVVVLSVAGLSAIVL
ncbi:DUF202 domain-containing protein [Rhodococcus jostii]|uniref:DUF202 domain-containing protein n=1 Tax=Rhodococcus jostii TaxID=132919 RepID=A0A1H5C1Z5_RHOJO|nr:DUF202 domain-containing protein [Rhodococcus jostii]SED60548.1 protein of unknown function [Rhodococcus jostii]